MKFEHRSHPLLPRTRFLMRLMRMAAIAAAVVLGSLGIGTLGYHAFEPLEWEDALLNAAMILTGMGPTTPMTTRAGKFFAVFYALFSGVVFLTTTALLFAPVFHRLIHRFHLELDDERRRHNHNRVERRPADEPTADESGPA